MSSKLQVLIIRGGIDSKTLDSVEEKLSGKSGEVLYFLLQTFGGEPHYGYRVTRLLQAKFKKIIAVVPNEAMSTGTLMVLGSDEIYMRKSSCLGPLDTQIDHPSDGSGISSIDIRDTTQTLSGLVQAISKSLFKVASENFKVGKNTAAKLAFQNAVSIMRPITDKIDPYHLQSSTRSAQVGYMYAKDLLASRMMKSNPVLANLVSRYLANQYVSHGYAITLQECKELLALNVYDLEQLTEWSKIKRTWDDSSDDGVYYIDVTSPKSQSGKAISEKAKAK